MTGKRASRQWSTPASSRCVCNRCALVHDVMPRMAHRSVEHRVRCSTCRFCPNWAQPGTQLSADSRSSHARYWTCPVYAQSILLRQARPGACADLLPCLACWYKWCWHPACMPRRYLDQMRACSWRRSSARRPRRRQCLQRPRACGQWRMARQRRPASARSAHSRQAGYSLFEMLSQKLHP